jgi:mannose-6-phosphate isomerase-like protein (cupin superfamily)
MRTEIEKTITDLDQFQVTHKGPLTVGQLLSAEESPDMSIAVIHVNGGNHQVRNAESEATYMILKGVGYFTVCDGGYPKTKVVRAGDVIRIPAGNPYKDVGADLLMVSINRPAFDPAKVTVLD